MGADAEAFAAPALDVLAVLAACASLGPFQQRLRGLVEAHRLPERLGSSRLSVVEASSDGVAPRLAHIRPVERMQGRPPVFENRAQVRGHHLVPRRRHLDRLQQEVPIILSARRPRVRVVAFRHAVAQDRPAHIPDDFTGVPDHRHRNVTLGLVFRFVMADDHAGVFVEVADQLDVHARTPPGGERPAQALHEARLDALPTHVHAAVEVELDAPRFLRQADEHVYMRREPGLQVLHIEHGRARHFLAHAREHDVQPIAQRQVEQGHPHEVHVPEVGRQARQGEAGLVVFPACRASPARLAFLGGDMHGHAWPDEPRGRERHEHVDPGLPQPRFPLPHEPVALSPQARRAMPAGRLPAVRRDMRVLATPPVHAGGLPGIDGGAFRKISIPGSLGRAEVRRLLRCFRDELLNKSSVHGRHRPSRIAGRVFAALPPPGLS